MFFFAISALKLNFRVRQREKEESPEPRIGSHSAWPSSQQPQRSCVNKAQKGETPPHQTAEQPSSQGRKEVACQSPGGCRPHKGLRLEKGLGGGLQLQEAGRKQKELLTTCQSPEAAGHEHCSLAPVGPSRRHSPRRDEALFPSQQKEAGTPMTKAILLKAQPLLLPSLYSVTPSPGTKKRMNE